MQMILFCWPLRPMLCVTYDLKICDIYASDYSIVFNASKSKCIFVQSCRDIASSFGPKSEIFIGGNLIEYVKQWPHLGHIITDTLEYVADIAVDETLYVVKLIICYVILVN